MKRLLDRETLLFTQQEVLRTEEGDSKISTFLVEMVS